MSFITTPTHSISVRRVRPLTFLAVIVCAGVLAVLLATSGSSTSKSAVTHVPHRQAAGIVVPRHSYGLVP